MDLKYYIDLCTRLSTPARAVNEPGFISAPYRPMKRSTSMNQEVMIKIDTLLDQLENLRGHL